MRQFIYAALGLGCMPLNPNIPGPQDTCAIYELVLSSINRDLTAPGIYQIIPPSGIDPMDTAYGEYKVIDSLAPAYLIINNKSIEFNERDIHSWFARTTGYERTLCSAIMNVQSDDILCEFPSLKYRYIGSEFTNIDSTVFSLEAYVVLSKIVYCNNNEALLYTRINFEIGGAYLYCFIIRREENSWHVSKMYKDVL